MEYINTRNTEVALAVKFTTDQTADISAGSPTGTLAGTAAVTSGKLDCSGNVASYCTYDAVSNADSAQVGAFRVRVTPKYSGIPADAGNKAIFTVCKALGDYTNLIAVMHGGDGNIYWEAKDSAGNAIFSLQALAAWSPVADTEYIFELDYDFTTGATRLFIDGVQVGSTDTSTGTRDTAVSVFMVGNIYDLTATGDMLFDDLVVFNDVQHTSNFTADYAISDQFDTPSGLAQLVTLYGYIYNANTILAGITIKVRPYQGGFGNPSSGGTGIFQHYDWTDFGVSAADGFFSGTLYLQPASKYWEIRIGNKSYYMQLPNQANVDIATLTLYPIA